MGSYRMTQLTKMKKENEQVQHFLFLKICFLEPPGGSQKPPGANRAITENKSKTSENMIKMVLKRDAIGFNRAKECVLQFGIRNVASRNVLHSFLNPPRLLGPV